MKKLVAYAKTTTVPFGSPGSVSQMHLIGEMFNLNYGTKFQHVAYRGVAPAMQDRSAAISRWSWATGLAKPLVTSGQFGAGGDRHQAKLERSRRADVYASRFSELRVNSWLSVGPQPGRHAEGGRRQDCSRCDQDRPLIRPQRAVCDYGWQAGGAHGLLEFTTMWPKTSTAAC